MNNKDVEEIKELTQRKLDEYNPYHDQKGRFSSGTGGGAAGGGKITGAKKLGDNLVHVMVGDTTYKASRKMHTTGATAGTTKSIAYSMRKKGWSADKPLKREEIPSKVLTTIQATFAK